MLPRLVVQAPPDPAHTRALATALGIPEPLAALLVQRGLGEPAAARAFLRPELEQLSDPLAWADMGRAAAVIAAVTTNTAPACTHAAAGLTCAGPP